MDNKDKRSKSINDILTHLAEAATAAADGVSDVMHSAGQLVGEKYSSLKLNAELTRLQDEQNKLFNNIGRTMYLIQTSSSFDDTTLQQAQMNDAKQTIDKLLLLADQKQQEIDYVTERLRKLNGAKVCYVCGCVCEASDTFCKVCGEKLPIE